MYTNFSPAIVRLLSLITLISSFLVYGALATSPKRGLSYNEDIPLQVSPVLPNNPSLTPNSSTDSSSFLFPQDFGAAGTQITWQYNWGSSTANKQPFAEYVPMLWNNASAATTAWATDAAAWLANASATTHLLAFNEPEQPQQANMAPAPAAAYYMQYMQPFAGSARLGAPAVSNDGYAWLEQFLGNCSACTIDFVPIHWYNPWNLTADLEDWVRRICALPGNRSVWVTEVRFSFAVPFFSLKPCLNNRA